MRCGVAIEELNQHKSPLGTSERKHGSDREKTADLAVRDRSDRLLWAVRPVGLDLKIQTGRAGFENTDRSDRLHRPVRPVATTGQTGSAQNRIPARELEVISRLLVQIITKWSQNLQGGSWDRDESLHKKN